jgi:tartrate-resistant acid phosphatase type 5
MVRLMVVGDTGTGNRDQYRVSRGMKKTLEEYPGTKAVCIVGDNIYDSGVTSVTDPQFKSKFEDPYRNINLPFYLCLGNHDYGNSIFDDKRYQHQIDYTNISPKWNMPARYYHKSFSPCDMFFVDTNLDHMSTTEISSQLRKIQGLYKKSRNPWKVLCGHHTWRSTGGHGNASHKLEQFLQSLFTKCDFDMYICGHDHCKNHSTVNLPNGRTVHTIVVGTGGKKYDDQQVFIENIHNSGDTTLHHNSSKLGYALLNASLKNMTVTFHKDNGDVEHTARFKKHGRSKKSKRRSKSAKKKHKRLHKTPSKRKFKVLKAGTGKTTQALQKLPIDKLPCDQISLAKLYYIALLSVNSPSAKLTTYKKTLEEMIGDKEEIRRYSELLNPNSWFMKWVVGGAGHLLGVTLGIWIYSQVGDPENDSSFKKGIAGGGALVGMTHQFFTDKIWPTFSGWVNREYTKTHSVTLNDSEIDMYLHEIYREWEKLACKGVVTYGIDRSCGLNDLEDEMLVV